MDLADMRFRASRSALYLRAMRRLRASRASQVSRSRLLTAFGGRAWYVFTDPAKRAHTAVANRRSVSIPIVCIGNETTKPRMRRERYMKRARIAPKRAARIMASDPGLRGAHRRMPQMTASPISSRRSRARLRRPRMCRSRSILLRQVEPVGPRTIDRVYWRFCVVLVFGR
jgi:hypothetical protein